MAVNWDRFAQGWPDPQEQESQAWAVCETCGTYLYPGDQYYDTDYGLCCDDEMCLAQLTGAVRKEAGA